MPTASPQWTYPAILIAYFVQRLRVAVKEPSVGRRLGTLLNPTYKANRKHTSCELDRPQGDGGLNPRKMLRVVCPFDFEDP
jgi:hypothetical protein